MTSPPLPPVTAASERLTRLREGYEDLPRARRTLLLYGAALLFGVLLMPFLIWLGGSRVLGPYTHGPNLHAGPLALLSDFLVGLAHGSAVFWVVALGPAVLLLLVRLLLSLLRARP